MTQPQNLPDRPGPPELRPAAAPLQALRRGRPPDGHPLAGRLGERMVLERADAAFRAARGRCAVSAVTLNYDEDAAASILAILRICPREQRLDTLVVVVKAFVESTPASAELRGESS